MQLLSQTQLNTDRGIIQLLHSRLGLDLCKCMAYGTANFMYIRSLNTKNILIGNYLNILARYEIVGDATVTNNYNTLTLDDIEDIIDDCYRELDRYNT